MKISELDYAAYELYLTILDENLSRSFLIVVEIETFVETSKKYPNNIDIKKLYKLAKIELRKQKLEKLK